MDATPVVRVACALIEDDAGRLLLAQRPPGKHLAGLWEFPGGKVEPGETPRQAMVREIAEELGCAVVAVAELGAVTHAYQDVTVQLIPFVARFTEPDAEPQPHEHAALRWVSRDEIADLPMPAADAPIVAEWIARGANRTGR
jgi:ADP-ribose pyrophosphatase